GDSRLHPDEKTVQQGERFTLEHEELTRRYLTKTDGPRYRATRLAAYLYRCLYLSLSGRSGYVAGDLRARAHAWRVKEEYRWSPDSRN
ncbi:MAG: hypothetical protein M1305_04435, partial [Candidatus Marsarchaeota archaeon]|nr:hypothetical protein [Candidatus Marsarchaeota archaeon]